LLLLADSFGLAALWGSPADGANAAIKGVCGFEATVDVMGLIYVGQPTGTVEVPVRPATTINWLD